MRMACVYAMPMTTNQNQSWLKARRALAIERQAARKAAKRPSSGSATKRVATGAVVGAIFGVFKR